MGFSIKINHRVGQPTVGFSINGDVAGGKRERGGMHQRWDFLWYVKWGYIIISQYVKHLIYLKYVGGMSCERKCSYSTGETSCSTILTVRPWLSWFSWLMMILRNVTMLISQDVCEDVPEEVCETVMEKSCRTVQEEVETFHINVQHGIKLF